MQTVTVRGPDAVDSRFQKSSCACASGSAANRGSRLSAMTCLRESTRRACLASGLHSLGHLAEVNSVSDSCETR